VTEDRSFSAFVEERESDLRRALTGEFGPHRGRDAAAQALLYGLENWSRVSELDNPAGYLFRVGQRWGRRQQSRPIVFAPIDQAPSPWFEPGLAPALAGLPTNQRVAVVLRCASDMAYADIAALTDQSEAAVRKQVERGLASLRQALEVNHV
jgi:RNA polymerase sigma-70 factor (ECF subfamily)